MHNDFSNYMHILSFKINLLVTEHLKNHIKLTYSASCDIVKCKGGITMQPQQLMEHLTLLNPFEVVGKQYYEMFGQIGRASCRERVLRLV